MSAKRQVQFVLATLIVVGAWMSASRPVSAAEHHSSRIGNPIGSSATAFVGHDNNGGGDPIVGTWLATVTPDPPDAPPPFPSLITFNAGGTAMFSAAGPPIPALGNPAHGSWKRIGAHRYAATYVQLTFDENLQLNGSLKVNNLITMNRAQTTITSVGQATIYDLDGNEIVTLTATEVATRLRVEGVH